MAGDAYDFWLFDLDGTVVDVDPDYPRDVIGEVGDRLGQSFTDREADLLWYGVGGARNGVFSRLGLDPDEFWDTFHEVEDPIARAESSFVYEDAAAFISGLDRPTGVVTHCQSYLTGPLLDHHDIADWFAAVVCCDDDIGWKPDPTPVELAMNRIGVGYNGHEGALVGDDPDDTGAAWNAGIDAIHVNRVDAVDRGQCVLGDRRIDGFDEL